ncbi:hypothetical protein KSP39_PZI016957 [Platanthera zijinensis]|uniref:Uncharacterized protein n=1 Tax=Platanthera zijinensis TaxID=2320716 RepID=A0AAP0B701_9ASPA
MEDQENVAKKLKSRTKLNARKRTYYQFRTTSVNTNLGCQVRQHLPILFSEHITNVIDVLGDGHCGYRVVGQALGKGLAGHKLEKISIPNLRISKLYMMRCLVTLDEPNYYKVLIARRRRHRLRSG